MTHRTLMLIVAAAAAALSGCGQRGSNSPETPDSFVGLGLMQLRDDLAYAVDSGQEFRIADAWIGRRGLRCGVLNLEGAAADVRFLVRKYGRPEKKVVTEKLPTWDAAEWAAECSDRTVEIMPDNV